MRLPDAGLASPSAQGDERRALSVLDSLDALWPAPRTAAPAPALPGRAGAHPRRAWLDGNLDSCCKALDELAADSSTSDLLPLQPEYRLAAAIAKAHAALARHDLDAADRQLDAADALAAALHRRLDRSGLQMLRAVIARRRGDSRALPLLREAIGLAAMAGQSACSPTPIRSPRR